MNTNTGTNEPAEVSQDLAQNARELLEATANVAGEKIAQARRRLTAAMDLGKDAWRVAQSKAVMSAKATDRVIRTNPYPTVGVAFGLGLLVGILVRRRA